MATAERKREGAGLSARPVRCDIKEHDCRTAPVLQLQLTIGRELIHKSKPARRRAAGLIGEEPARLSGLLVEVALRSECVIHCLAGAKQPHRQSCCARPADELCLPIHAFPRLVSRKHRHAMGVDQDPIMLTLSRGVVC
ncbi:hypothetical protein D3C80_1662110 [compost metagenome]